MRRFSIGAAWRVSALLIVTSFAGGCVLAPRAMKEERAKLESAGRPFEPDLAERSLPQLPDEPDWRELLQRAFLANGELEAAYFEWKAAIARVGIAGAYPNTNVSLGFEYLFSGGKMKGWDRTTLSVGFDPMQNLSFPLKVMAAGKVAFEDARAAAERFRSAKFGLQERVLTAYLDYALTAEKIRIQREQLTLLRFATEAASARVVAGDRQADLLSADVAARMAENDLRSLEAALPAEQARLNALVGRDAGAPLLPPRELPAARRLAADDAHLLAVAVDNNPELAALARDVQGRRNALEFARLQYFPDINPFVGFTGSMEQVVGAAITLPTMVPKIRAAIAEAEALLRRSEAMARQARLDRGANFVATLVALRDAERQQALIEEQIRPVAELTLDNVQQSYSSGSATLANLIESQRLVLDLQRLSAEARTQREQRLAELEALAGIDIETLTPVDDVAAADVAGGSHHD